MKTIVVIPTYDEKENVKPMAEAVLGSGLEDVEILFVDDNSPDGTGAIIDEMSKTEPRIHCLHRTKKEGLGRAYVAGFEKALDLGAERVVQMDCDFSHDPKDLPRMVEATCRRGPLPASEKDSASSSSDAGRGPRLQEDADLVIGSRYVKGGSTPGWPFKRRLISRAGGIFIRFVTGMPLRDPTGGFKCWKASTLRGLDLATVQSAGYSFQLEMNHRTWKRGFTIKEIPISFHDRQEGYSKITPGIAVESIKIALKLRFS